MNFFEWLDPTQTSPVWQEYKEQHSAAYPYNGLEVAKTKDGVAYDVSSEDSLANALNTAATWDREDRIRSEQYAREDNAYVNLFNQLKSQGINPALLLSSAGPTVGSAGGYTTSAFKTSNTSATERTEAANSAKMAGSIFSALAIIAAALIAAA